MDDLKYQVNLLTALNEKIMNSERIYRQIAESSGNVYLYYDYRNYETRVDLIGPWDELVGEKISNHPYDEAHMTNYILEEDQDIFRNRIINIEREGLLEDSLEFRSRTRKYSFRATAIVRYDETDHRPIEKLITFENITKDKARNDELQYLAYYDTLTGLYNRNKFVANLRNLCEKAEEETSTVEVMFIDIDDFKKINDSVGLLLGDELVQEFALFLKSLQNEDITAGRFGSDMFVVSIYNPCGQKTADNIYRKIRERIRHPFVLSNNTNVVFTVSCGVAEYPDAGRSAVEVIKNSEIVLYKAKDHGRNSIQFFEPEILTKFINDVTIEKQLKNAINNNEFVLYFQPQFMADTGKIRGVEALIRWPNNKGGFVSSPSEFIPVAEKNGEIVALSEWVIKDSMRIFNELRHKYHLPMILSVNISANHLRKDNFIELIQNLIMIYEIAPENLEFEITESAFIKDFDDAIAKINILRKMGIKIALDDFGTGYSSLTYLRRFPIDTLKIDRSFIDTITTDDSTAIITDSIIKMAGRLGIRTIAEGVETKDQLLILQKYKCEVIQGYLLGKPMAKSELEKLIIRQLP